MYVWRHIPLLRFLIPFILGIFCYVEFRWTYFPMFVFLGFGIPLLFGAHIYFRNHINRPLQQLVSLLALLHFFVAGYLITVAHEQVLYPSHYTYADKASELLVRIKNNPQQKVKSISCHVELLSAIDSTGSRSVLGDAQLYFQKDSLSALLAYGDYLLIANRINGIITPKNPHQFNFKKYYAQRNIYHQGYLSSGMWKHTGQNKTNWLYAMSYQWQAYFKKQFSEYFKDREARGVAQAIVFGYKEDLDDEWLEAFSKTGTIHVLAVSGLHVGIIYLLLSGILLMRRSNGRSLKLKSAVILLCLFAYCLLTGFAPSVSRASIMFGVVIVAKAFQRRSNIYNTLSFACFLLLVISPYNLYNVGFQFSFLAVVGIVYYTDTFRKWVPVSSYLGDKVVTLLSVSVAAQITTFPIGLYYFHQYPNLFMISNLIVIPCITVILYLGILFLLVVPFSNMLASFCAKAVMLYIDFIAGVVHFLQDIPYAFFEGIHITLTQMLCIYGLILGITFSTRHKSKTALALAATCVLIFLKADISFERHVPRSEVALFKVGRDLLVGLREGNKISFVASEGIYKDQKKLDFIVRPYLVKERLDREYAIIPALLLGVPSALGTIEFLGNGVVWYDNKSYLFLDYTNTYIRDTLKLDCVIVGKSKSVDYMNKVLPRLQSDRIYIPAIRANETSQMDLLKKTKAIYFADYITI